MASIATSLASLVGRIYYGTESPSVYAGELGLILPGPWRPPQWAAKRPPVTIVVTDQDTTVQTAYVFDAATRVSHEQQSAVTLNPVQDGAPLADHGYVLPSRVTLELAMSDSMQSYTFGQWSDGPSRSVSAYQKLKQWQRQRTAVAVLTRLETYRKMWVTDVQAEDNNQQGHALKATVTLTEILVAAVGNPFQTSAGALNSAIPQSTASTIVGQVNTVPVPASVQAQNFTSAQSAVPGAGQWSSVPVP